MRQSKVTQEPQSAPKNYRELPPKMVTSDGDGLWETWHGSGVPSTEACGACGNTEGNRQIYGNSGSSYPNGTQWDDAEIVCARCGRYTLVNVFIEG